MKSRARCVMAIAAAALFVAASARAGQASKVDVTGKWLFNVETAAGSGTPTITLKQDGEKLTGHYSGQFGEIDNLTGTIKGRDLTLKFSADAQGTSLEFTYTGTVEGSDTMKGKVNIAGLGDGTWTAKKQ
ncbi:MAG TPA: hypothetical protein VKE51_01610 [Vicinamibacterales bacterium]|nr:hypothetical protein [Vicinamibacterales bacterium]